MSSNWRPIILPGQESRPGSNSNLPGRNSKQQFENFLPGRNSNKGFANFYRVGICSHLGALFFLFGLRATHCNTKHLFDNIHHYNSIMMQFNISSFSDNCYPYQLLQYVTAHSRPLIACMTTSPMWTLSHKLVCNFATFYKTPYFTQSQFSC